MEKIAFLFPGQGSQYVGMGKDLFNNYGVAKDVFNRANEILGFDLKGLCFEGDINELTRTKNAQPAILTMSVAAFQVLRSETGIEPDYLAGHSLGEFSALTCAGAVNFEDALQLVYKRGKLMEEAVQVGLGSMAAVSGADIEAIEEACRKYTRDGQILAVSNYNAADQIVISGHSAAIVEASQSLSLLGATVIPIKVSTPFHSPMMQPAADLFREELRKYKYNSFKYPVIANINALPYTGIENIIENLTEQIVMPVKWYETMKYLEEKNAGIALEVGPDTVLRNLMKKHSNSIKAFSYDKTDDIKAFIECFPQHNPDVTRQTRLRLIARCMAIAVCTKNSNWDSEAYAKGVIEPYKRIKAMYEELESSGSGPSEQQMKDALEMLKSVFITKQTETPEQTERFNQLFGETGLGHLFEEMKLPR